MKRTEPGWVGIPTGGQTLEESVKPHVLAGSA
jgi:hypothetical protein